VKDDYQAGAQPGGTFGVFAPPPRNFQNIA